MNSKLTPQINKHWCRVAFDRAADSYEENAVLQHEVGERMLERLDLMRIQPQLILDAGAGTGRASKALVKRYRKAKIIALDMAPKMLGHTRARMSWLDRLRGRCMCVCADVEDLPMADNSVDMIFSNLTLQWCNELDQVLQDFMRVLRPGGLLMFTSFGPGTLHELRDSWSQADGYQHVNQFIDMHDVGDILHNQGWSGPVMDSEVFTLTYPDVKRLMRDLKLIGAHNVTYERAHGLTGKQRVQKMTDAYESYRNDGVLPASYEVVYGHAWAVDDVEHTGGTPVAMPSLQGFGRHE